MVVARKFRYFPRKNGFYATTLFLISIYTEYRYYNRRNSYTQFLRKIRLLKISYISINESSFPPTNRTEKITSIYQMGHFRITLIVLSHVGYKNKSGNFLCFVFYCRNRDIHILFTRFDVFVCTVLNQCLWQ